MLFSKTIPGKFQTYLYFAKPLIVISNGYILEKTKKYSLGEWSNSGNYKDLYKKIILLSSNKNKIKLYSKNCRSLYNNKYNLKYSVECLLNKFKELVY